MLLYPARKLTLERAIPRIERRGTSSRFYRVMPIYEYQCKKCRHRFEKIQKFSDPHVKKCPKCGSAVELLLSAPTVQFKGSGWYVTDYAKKSGTASSAANGDSASKKEGK